MDEDEATLLKDSVKRATDRNKYVENRSLKDLTKIINVVEMFLRRERVMCYGGTAINAVLPPKDRFYDPKLEVPDYDFFSVDAIGLTSKLADIYAGNPNYMVDAKSGVHLGTYKVFVNFIPMADITQLTPAVFNNLWKERVTKDRIHYVPVDFLRWSMYLELSRPKGDVSRWSKVAERLHLLNRNYPIKSCRSIKTIMQSRPTPFRSPKHSAASVFNDLRKAVVSCDVICFGRYAHQEYRRLMYGGTIVADPIFELISNDADATARAIQRKMPYAVTVEQVEAIGEQVPRRVTVALGGCAIAHIYQSTSCYSYTKLSLPEGMLKIASAETFLSFYLIFLYVDGHYDTNVNIRCIANDMLAMQRERRLDTTGLMRRFAIECDGRQVTQRDVSYERTRKYQALKDKKSSPEYIKWFYKWQKKGDGRASAASGKRTRGKRTRGITRGKRTRGITRGKRARGSRTVRKR